MTGVWFRISAALVALAFVAPQLMADAPNNEAVGEKIDRITEPPDYDWLRAPKRSRLRSGSRSGRGRAMEGEGRPGNRAAADRVVDNAVRIDRQVQALQIGERRHDDVADPMQSVGERRGPQTEHRGVRPRAGRAEPQLVDTAVHVVRIDADDAIVAVCVGQR